MEYVCQLPLEYQFVDKSYEDTCDNLYKYHEINKIQILYDGFIEFIATKYFKENNLDIETTDVNVLRELNISGI
jgi:hypothetical protein